MNKYGLIRFSVTYPPLDGLSVNYIHALSGHRVPQEVQRRREWECISNLFRITGPVVNNDMLYDPVT